MKLLIPFTFMQILVALTCLCVANADDSAQSDQIDLAGRELARAEQPSNALEKFPRADVIARVKVWIKNPSQEDMAARTVLKLQLHEVLPDILERLPSTHSYMLVIAASRIANPNDHARLEKVFLQSYSSDFPVAIRSAMLDEMEIPLKDSQFFLGIEDRNPLFVISLVRHFLRTRNGLSSEQQIARFKALMNIQYVTVKTAVLSELGQIKENVRSRMIASIPNQYCEGKLALDIKAQCLNLLKARAMK